MLPKIVRLRHQSDFARLSVKGRPLYGPFCILRAWKSGSTPSKIGFVASGKIFRKATERNFVRRRMREAFRPLLSKVPHGYDMIFVARPEAKKADFEEIRKSLEHLIEKMPKEMERPYIRRPKAPKSRKGQIEYAKQLGVPRPPGRPPQEKKT
ncbi:ribonuclease P protein component [candidate division WWE3 bacterium]|uniref:Ribonuclease P protein component n=1 Tax=candidate division WWE3 bacterium TaxID=2053526 RepID=A0A928TQC6_UNCKA|nr:ribonuclease P protein component [candidate division WWE3 bacterium]